MIDDTLYQSLPHMSRKVEGAYYDVSLSLQVYSHPSCFRTHLPSRHPSRLDRGAGEHLRVIWLFRGMRVLSGNLLLRRAVHKRLLGSIYKRRTGLLDLKEP